MLILTIWLGLMTVGGLCYPRRPLATGVIFLVAGVFMSFMWASGAIGVALPVAGAMSAVLGLGKLWQFRNPAARAAHLVEWTGKA
jgi:hypothetical protein